MREIRLYSFVLLGVAAIAPAQVDYNYSTDIANPVVDTSGVFHGNSGNQMYSKSNTVGGYVAYNTPWNIGAGTFGAYDHTCISTPTTPGTPNDRANCNLNFFASDTMTIASSTLANGTPVSLVICVEGSETLQDRGPGTPSNILQGEQVGATFAFTGLYSGQGSKRISGGLQSVDFVRTYSGTMNVLTNKVSGTIAFNGIVGQSFTLQESFTAFGNVQTYPGGLYDFEVGMGATWGLDSTSTPGFFLTSAQTGTTWGGTCGGSTGFIPNDPVPEPSSLLGLLGFAGILILSRKTRIE